MKLPERKKKGNGLIHSWADYNDGYNQCLDDLASLNQEVKCKDERLLNTLKYIVTHDLTPSETKRLCQMEILDFEQKKVEHIKMPITMCNKCFKIKSIVVDSSTWTLTNNNFCKCAYVKPLNQDKDWEKRFDEVVASCQLLNPDGPTAIKIKSFIRSLLKEQRDTFTIANKINGEKNHV